MLKKKSSTLEEVGVEVKGTGEASLREFDDLEVIIYLFLGSIRRMYLYHNDFDGADDFLGPGKNRLHRLPKKEEQSLYNRLRTIVLDKEYVDKVAKYVL